MKSCTEKPVALSPVWLGSALACSLMVMAAAWPMGRAVSLQQAAVIRQLVRQQSMAHQRGVRRVGWMRRFVSHGVLIISTKIEAIACRLVWPRQWARVQMTDDLANLSVLNLPPPAMR